MQNENTFYFVPDHAEPIPVDVLGTGNVGRAAIRAVDTNPAPTRAGEPGVDDGLEVPLLPRHGRPGRQKKP